MSKPNSQPGAPARHRAKRVAAEVLAIGLLAALIVPASAFAGKPSANGGQTSGASLTLVVLDEDGVANHGDRVTFEAQQSSTDRPFVGVRCFQGSNFVLDGYVGLFDEYMFDPWVTLGSDYWAAGVEATCTARLFYVDRRGREKVLATKTFVALP